MAPTANKDDKPEDDVPLPPDPFTTTVYVPVPSPTPSLSSTPSMSGGYPPGFSSFASSYLSTSIDAAGNTVYLANNFPLSTKTASQNAKGAENTSSPPPTRGAGSTNAPPGADSPTASIPGSQTSPTDNPGFEYEQKHHSPPVTFIAMGIIIPLLIILSALALFFWYRRHKRNERENEANIAGVMSTAAQAKGTQPNMIQTEMPYIHTPGAPVAAAAAVPSPTSTTTTPTSNPTQPVILTTTMNNTYYTGIDTSDHISLTDQRSQTSAESIHGEEPPPPYRPRSVPPISRETSLRQAVLGRNPSARSGRHDPMSGAGLIRRSDEVRSPFDDPESSDDDALSQISTIRSYPRTQTDRLSVVSDMSEDENPRATHSAV